MFHFFSFLTRPKHSISFMIFKSISNVSFYLICTKLIVSIDSPNSFSINFFPSSKLSLLCFIIHLHQCKLRTKPTQNNLCSATSPHSSSLPSWPHPLSSPNSSPTSPFLQYLPISYGHCDGGEGGEVNSGTRGEGSASSSVQYLILDQNSLK